MASPTVVSRSTPSAVTTAGTTHTVNLPGSISAGNRLEIFFAYMAPTGSETVSATDWTADTGFYTVRGTAQAIHRLWKIATGSEGATVDVTSSGSTKSAHTAYQISGSGDPYGVAGLNGNAANAASPDTIPVTDPPKDILVIAVMALEGEVFTGLGPPLNYTNNLTANTSTGGAVATNGLIQSAERAVTGASSENPGTFSHVADDWVTNAVLYPEPTPPAEPPWGEPIRRLRRVRLAA